MKRRTRRSGVALVAAALAIFMIAPASSLASTPGWYFTVDNSLSPPVVGTGYNAAFVVTITNAGPSNISALYLSTDIPKTAANVSPTYIGPATYSPTPGSGPTSPCNPAGSGPLYCSFGSLANGASVTLTVAFKAASPGTNIGNPNGTTACLPLVDTEAWTFHFTAFGNGNTPSDKGTKSHGDTLCGQASIDTSSSKDFAGGFTLDTTTFSTSSDNFGKNNKQTTGLTPPEALIPATVEDGSTVPAPTDCQDSHCANAFGEWSKLSVRGGHNYSPTAFKVVILVWGGAVPGGTSPGDIVLLRVADDGSTTDVIDLPCTFDVGSTTPNNPECLTVTKVGPNFRIVAWVFHNGWMKGAS